MFLFLCVFVFVVLGFGDIFWCVFVLVCFQFDGRDETYASQRSAKLCFCFLCFCLCFSYNDEYFFAADSISIVCFCAFWV